MHFEVFKDVEKKFRFRLRADNGEIIATGEAYETNQACLDTIRVMKANIASARVTEVY